MSQLHSTVSDSGVDDSSVEEEGITHNHSGTCPLAVTVACAVAASAFLLSTVTLAILLSYTNHSQTSNQRASNKEKGVPLQWPAPSGTGHGHFKRAAVAADPSLCSEIARNVMMIGGNAIDSTIAAMFCGAVVSPESMGLGGGFMMTFFDSATGKCTTINAREAAPMKANKTMFVQTPSDAHTGYRSIAVPSLVHGLWTAYTNYGSGAVTWSRLIEPSIELARRGFPVSSHLAFYSAVKRDAIVAEKTLREAFVDSSTQQLYKEGDMIHLEKLGATLQQIADSADPIDLFYKGEIAETIAKEMKENGGYISKEDLRDYRTHILHDVIVNNELPGGLSICGPPPPSSFAVAASIVAVMTEFYGMDTSVDLDDPLLYHRLIEAEKFAYGRRSQFGDAAFVQNALMIATNITSRSYARWIKSMIKDESQAPSYYMSSLFYQPEDHGTAHTSVIDPQGNAVSCTASINQLFGSKRVSPSLGIVWNDEMDDFSTPGVVNQFGFAPSEANFIAPGKRPMSSMSPTIVYHKANRKVRLVVGSSGGSKIISAVAQTAIRFLMLNQTIKQAVDSVRFHNQFTPFYTQYEADAPKELIEMLKSRFKQDLESEPRSTSSVQAIAVTTDGTITANSDFRRKSDMHPGGF